MGEQSRVEAALRALEGSCGVRGEVDGGSVGLSWRGQLHRFRVEPRASVRPAHVAFLRERVAAGEAREPMLLVTRHVGPPLADQLRRGGIPFVDEAGNAWVETPDWAVFVSGRSGIDQKGARPSVSKTMWQVAYVLLRGGPEAATVRDLAARSGVSHGTAANALAAFERHGWIGRYEGAHPLEDPDGLLGGWEFGYSDRLRRSLDLGFAVAPGARSLAAWAESIREHLGPDRGLLGGELAAELMGTDIVAASATLHLPRWDAETMRALAVVPAKEGPIAVRRLFGTCNHSPEEPGLADPLLVRAEVLGLHDDRLDATRTALRERIVARWRR